MNRKPSSSLLLAGVFSTAAAFLSGCAGSFSAGPTADSDAAQTSIGEIQGSVHGGQSPVTGAKVYMLAAGTGGYGTASTSLIPTSKNGVNGVSCSGGANGYCYVTTDGSGNFSVGGDYLCTLGQQVYIVAVGGNPGASGSGVNNTAIVQMAGLGGCPAAGNLAAQVPYLVINEVTTVAFAYAMGSFGTDAYHIASSGTPLAQTAIANAMLNANNIVALAWGAAMPVANVNSNSVAPQAKINALADIIATCVNTTAATSTQCSNLFNASKNSAGTKPVDEATALFNIVHNPSANASTIWGLYPSTPVFTPVPSAAPTDWTMPVVYNNVAGQVSNIAMDSNGNAWINDSTNKAVVRVSAQGAVSSFKNGGSFGAIAGVAVNPVTGRIWASDTTNNKVYILDSTGSLLTTITLGSLNKPAAIAFDTSGNGYVVNSGAYLISEYNSAGTLLRTATYPSAQGYSTSIAVDYSGNVYTGAGTGNAGVGALPAATTTSQYYSGSNNGGVYSIALDDTNNTVLTPAQYWTQANNVWTMSAGAGIGWRYYFYTTGYQFGGIVDGTYIGWVGGMTTSTSPSSLAFDGAGNLWVAEATPTKNSTYPLSAYTVSSGYTLTAIAANGFTTGTAAPASTAPATGATVAMPDTAGNVWVANTDGTVSQMLGLATPVVAPLVPGKFATAP